jgi:hypothetical protein
MFQYRQALVRMRQGDSDRQIATARIVGRRVAAPGCANWGSSATGLTPLAPCLRTRQ